jgi:RNA polymerase sigma-70 factor (ECF subfamily)
MGQMSAPAEIALGAGPREITEVAAAAREGDRRDFDRLVTEYSSPVWALALRLSGNRTDAEDLVQETYLRAFRGIRKLRKQGSELGWLRRILVNAWRDRYRRARPTVPLADPAGAPADPAGRLAHRDLLARVLAAVLDLPRRQREALLLRVQGQLSRAEVADAMAIRPGAVKAHLVQARRKLIRRFGKEIEEWT